MEPDRALALARTTLEPLPHGLRLETDEAWQLRAFVRRDLLHLDADALNDRLHAWVAREVRARLPTAEALVDFRHAHPASSDEADLDVQAGWRDLEPTFRLDLHPPVSDEDVRAFARLVPRFLRLLEQEGRPDGWRDVEMGATE